MPTMQFTLEDAQEVAVDKLGILLGGQPGAGKSYTALMLANQFVKRTGGFVGVIESEQGRSRHYGDRFHHKLVRLPDTNPDTYIEAMRFMLRQGCKVLIIDSLTHAWEGVKDVSSQAAKEKFQGNTWSGWSVGKAKQRQLIDSIARYPGFVIATCRMKLKTELDEKRRVHTVGMEFEQSQDIEYEFDLACRMDVVNLTQHELTVLKSVLGEYLPVGATMMDPDERLAQAIWRWLDRGGVKQPVAVAAPARPAAQPAPKPHFEEEADQEFSYTISDEPLYDPAALDDSGPGVPPMPYPGSPEEEREQAEEERRQPQRTPPVNPVPPAQPAKPQTRPWNVPERQEKDDETMASGQQITSLKKMGAILGYGEDVPPMTYMQAGVLISRLSGEYSAMRKSGNMGSGGGPGINQRAAEERAAAAPAAKPSRTPAALAEPDDNPFGDE